MATIDVPGSEIVGLRANNPGILSLGGTNSWIVERDPAWIVDPGPSLDDHVAALRTAVQRRGGLGGIALTHDHVDHTEAVGALLEAFPGTPVLAGRGPASSRLVDGERYGPLLAVATPGHTQDHFGFLCGRVLFSGDAVLGEGSVFIAPDSGALAGYLAALERLRALSPSIICPGHGPLVLDADAKLAEYLEHRLERERLLLEALEQGARTPDDLLDRVWSDVAPQLRPAAAVTLVAHLDKLDDEGRLPAGVRRPALPAWLSSHPH